MTETIEETDTLEDFEKFDAAEVLRRRQLEEKREREMYAAIDAEREQVTHLLEYRVRLGLAAAYRPTLYNKLRWAICKFASRTLRDWRRDWYFYKLDWKMWWRRFLEK